MSEIRSSSLVDLELVSDAARRLSVSPLRVRQLIHGGQLDAVRVGNRWMVDRASVEQRLLIGAPAGRPWSQRVVWAAIDMLDGRRPVLSASERHRLAGRLGGRDLEALLPKLRHRADEHRFWAHPSALPRLAEDSAVARSGVSASGEYGADIIAVGAFEGYVAEADLEVVAARHGLRRDGRGMPNVVLRSVQARVPAKWGGVAPAPAVVLDLLESDDPRSRRAGRQLAVQIANRAAA